jgi:hypothetical protein
MVEKSEYKNKYSNKAFVIKAINRISSCLKEE